MSKRSERKQRKQEKLKKDVRMGWIVAGIGIIFLVLGIVGVILEVSEYREYTTAKESIKVPCEITSVSVRTAENEYGTKETVYDTKLAYDVDGEKYSGEKRFYEKVSKGDTREVAVYQKSNGKYAVVRTTNEVALFYELVIPGIGLLAGLLLTAAGIVVAVSSKKEMKAK